MRKNIWNSTILICICFVVQLSSCKTIKNVENGKNIKVLSQNDLIDSIKTYELKIDWLKASGNTIIKLGEEKQNIDLNIRIRKDSIIWINLSKYKKKISRSLFEMDSVKITTEYPEKLYYFESINKMQEVMNFSISYNILEEFLLGGSFIDELNDKLILKTKENQYYISSKKNNSKNIIYESWINPINFKCDRINLFFRSNSSNIEISYDNWKMIDRNLFPTKINVYIKTLSNDYSIEITYKNIKFDTPQNFPKIKIDSKYQPLIINE